jgi:hypothetical protein
MIHTPLFLRRIKLLGLPFPFLVEPWIHDRCGECLFLVFLNKWQFHHSNHYTDTLNKVAGVANIFPFSPWSMNICFNFCRLPCTTSIWESEQQLLPFSVSLQMFSCRNWIRRIQNDWWLEHLPAPEVSCWTVAGERQSTRLRSLYLEAVLRQDIAFFDVEMTTAEAASRMSADTVLIQDALGEKVIRKSLFFRQKKVYYICV